MKKYLLLAVTSYLSFTAMAQTSQPLVKYFLPDGKIVADDKLDSVTKAWGNKGFMMTHDDKHPDEVHLFPMTDELLKEAAEKKANLNKMLNQPAPDFKLTDLSGKTYSLNELKGKVVVLNFWFTSCMPCMDEMPKLNAIKKKYEAANVVFLAFALDNKAAITTFLKKHTFEYNILPGAQEVSKAYHVSSYPTSIVIDKKGVIRFLQITGANIGIALPSAIDAVL